MKSLLLLCLLFISCAAAFGQSGRLTGLVLDSESRAPLELATVSILGQDSALIAYRLSDKNGRFLFDKLPLKRKLMVSVTYTGYQAFGTNKELQAGKTDTLLVVLAMQGKQADAVVVSTVVPIRMNGDTLELNPAGFKLKPDAVVEELLNQVSGITIWSDGTITVNGRKVQNVLVDGKPFLGSTDPRIATQNLPKTAIDKIQLYQEYDRANIGRQSQPTDSLLTMNIKLKESSKTGYFGKAGAGYGSSQRYEADLTLQAYNKKSSVGMGGGINNINKNIGNLQELFQNNTYRTTNPNMYNVGRFGASGINHNYAIGAVATHSFTETVNSRQNNRLVVNYNATGTDAFVENLSLQNRTTVNNPQFIRSQGEQNNRSNRHNLSINYVKTNSYNDNLSVNGNFGHSKDNGQSMQLTEVRDSANRLQNTNRSTTVSSRWSDNESLNANFTKSDRDDPLKTFSLQLVAQRNNSTAERTTSSAFESVTDNTKNISFNRRYNTNNQSLNAGMTLDYLGFKRFLLGRYNLFGVDLNFVQSVNYNRTSDNVQVGDYDSSTAKYRINANLTNQNKREIIDYTPALALSKGFSKWGDRFSRSFNAQIRLAHEFKTERNTSSFAKRNLERSFRFLRYEGSLNYHFQKREKFQYSLSASYAKGFDYPSIDQLYTIVDDINVYDVRVGNPNLLNRVNHRYSFNGNFNTQNPRSAYAVNGNIGGSYNRSVNITTDSVINDPSGKRITYFVNGNGSQGMNLNYNINISRKIKTNSLQLMYNGNINSNDAPNYIDRLYNISRTHSVNNQFTLQYSLRSLMVLTIGQSFQTQRTEQTARGLSPFTNSGSSTRFGLVLNLPFHLTLSSTADRIANSNLSEPTTLWNAFATYRFLKQQGELKFAAMDLLKQYQNISNSVNAYGTTTTVTNGLQQFFLLTFSYYPRKFGKPEVKR